MIRVIATVWVSSMLALAGLVGPGAASADPWPPSPCGFSITPPEVVQVDGVSKVTATVTSQVCGVAASPYKSVACVSLLGPDANTACMQGTDTAQAYYDYKPGATYTSSGRGCGIIVPTLPADNCQILGPVQVTL